MQHHPLLDRLAQSNLVYYCHIYQLQAKKLLFTHLLKHDCVFIVDTSALREH
jgi:hypothetical protein